MLTPPTDISALYSEALGHHRSGRLTEAEQIYRRILAVDPNQPETLHLLGVVYHQTGRQDLAIESIGRAIARKDAVAAFHSNLGLALQAQGRLCEAAARFRRAIALAPDSAEAYINLGFVLPDLGLADEAVSCLQQAIALQPDSASAYYNLGAVERNLGRLEQAAAHYLHCTRLKPDWPEAHAHLATVLADAGRIDEAVDHYGQTLALKPDFPEALNSLGLALEKLGRQAEAVAHFDAAIALDPTYAQPRLSRAMSSLTLFADNADEHAATLDRFSRSLTALAEWDSGGRLGAVIGMAQPFNIAYLPGNPCAVLSRYGDVASTAAAAYWRGATPDAPPRRDRIRLAVVSGHIRRHSVWDIVLKGVIAHLDRARFELVIYSTDSAADGETAWAERHADLFVGGPKPVAAWIARIHEDRPDILFYPEIGMDRVACTLAALRLAPVQVASWGHPVTTGLPTIDLYLSGELLEGPDADSHYRERLVRLPGTGVCTQALGLEAQAAPLPAPTDPATVRFALCQSLFKFDPAFDDLYTRIAQAVGPCEFWLVNPTDRLSWALERVHDRLAKTFTRHGLDPVRHLRTSSSLPRARFLGYLDAMDVYLDCPAFSGYTTAWQATHRGLPIVTLEGAFLRQRLAAGLLRRIGQTDTIAATPDDYVEIAVHLGLEARDPELRSARRQTLQAAAPLADDNVDVVRAFERVLIDGLKVSIVKAAR